MADQQIARIVIKASVETSAEIGFEPLGTSFVLTGDDYLVLEVAPELVDRLEFAWFPNGLAVWAPYPEPYTVRNSAGEVVHEN